MNKHKPTPKDHQKLKGIGKPVKGKLIGDAVIPAGVSKVIGPAFVGNRYTVDNAPRVVDSSQCRPWAVAAAGG